MNTLTRERLEQIYAECEERDPAITEIRAMVAELQERRKADTVPVYQFRIRNSYNGFTTEWQTLKNREDVDFVLKEQPLNSEFRIIGSAPIVPDGWKLVPVIAFPSQWAAGQRAFDLAGINKVDAVYKAMVAAAPQPEVNRG